MAGRRTRIELPDELLRAVDAIESAMSETGYMGFFDFSGGSAHVDSLHFDGELHVKEENQWFLFEAVD